MQNLRALGHHTILDMYNCNPNILDNSKMLEEIMLEAARLAKATIIKSHFHQFTPQGVSGSIIIAESHFNIHTWPEHGYAAIDLFTCGKDLNASLAIAYLIKKLKSKTHALTELNRGQGFRDLSKVENV